MTDQALAPFERRNDETSVFRRSTGGDDDDDDDAKGLVGMEAPSVEASKGKKEAGRGREDEEDINNPFPTRSRPCCRREYFILRSSTVLPLSNATFALRPTLSIFSFSHC